MPVAGVDPEPALAGRSSNLPGGGHPHNADRQLTPAGGLIGLLAGMNCYLESQSPDTGSVSSRAKRGTFGAVP